MSEMELIIDLHKGGHRQGPGGDDETRLAIALSGLKAQAGLDIADIGSGTGASTLVLAKELDARITAVDFLPDFLEPLATAARKEGVAERITTQTASMDALTFEPASLDAIWSEGAIYNMGFENGIRAWREFLKPGGILAVSELSWLTGKRPADLEAHWVAQYPEVATVSTKMEQLEAAGYALLGYFPLPEHCWLDNYYAPMQARFDDFLVRHDHSEDAKSIVAAEEEEIDLYRCWSAYFGYGYYIARRIAD